MRFRKKQQKSGDAEFQMAPMIDIVFLLLSFFIFTSALKIEETEIGITLPPPGTIDKEIAEDFKDEVVIVILEDGGIVVNRQQYDSSTDRQLPELAGMLQMLVEAFGAKQEVIIRGNPRVWHGRIVDVLNACAGAGVKRISFYSE